MKSFVNQVGTADPAQRDTLVYNLFKDLVCKETFCKAAELISVETLKERSYGPLPVYVVAQILHIKSSLKAKTISTENAAQLKAGGKRDAGRAKATGGKREVFYDRMVVFRCAGNLSRCDKNNL
jgi:hypothetical protein